MKRKLPLYFLLSVCLVLCLLSAGCAYDLEETEGVFSSLTDFSDMSGECEHRFQYGLTVFCADSNIYPAARYHYVSCAMYGEDPFCGFYPRCEEHTRVDDPDGVTRTVLAYNGHLYRVVPQICSVCHQMAGERYILAETEE